MNGNVWCKERRAGISTVLRILTKPNLHILLLFFLNAKLKIWRHHKETQAFKLSLNCPMFMSNVLSLSNFFNVFEYTRQFGGEYMRSPF